MIGHLAGKAVSPGYAKGTAFIYGRGLAQDVARYAISSHEIAGEFCRFDDALQRSCCELRQLQDRVARELGQAHSAIFSAHLSLLQDEHFIRQVKERVQADLINVEQALEVEVATLCERLSSVDSEFIRQRAQDICDVARRVMRQLATGDAGRYVDLPAGSVIVAHELLPSETLDLDREHVVAIVTEEGGENSHAAILARALGIPAVTGVPSATTRIPAGTVVLVDGEAGAVHIEPSQAVSADFTIHKSQYDKDTATAVAAERLDCQTRDGTRISLLANINRPREALLVNAHHLDGVGLFRTEFMFLDSTTPPSLDRQVDAYRQVIGTVGKRSVVIRTLDLGGDKLPAFLPLHNEENPNLGSRGLRFSLAERTLFETQIRAIVAAATSHEAVRVLLPMVLGPADLEQAARIVQQLCLEQGRSTRVPIGAMIETPAALFALDEICEIADFVCIGTNDLTQFMLAADRNSSELADEYSVLHPSVLRAIGRVVEAGRAAGRDVCVCGEAASYPRTASLLVGLGLRQLSMSALRAARVRYYLRATCLSQLEHVAQRALSRRSAEDVRVLLNDLPPDMHHFEPTDRVGQ